MENSLLDGLLISLPALSLSQKIQSRVAKVGFDWPNREGIYDKLGEEIGELRSALTDRDRQAELGDILLVVVNLARRLDIDAESALREANRRFEQRFRIVEKAASRLALDFSTMSLADMDALWDEAKEFLANREADD